jgi:hypothetical protein
MAAPIPFRGLREMSSDACLARWAGRCCPLSEVTFTVAVNCASASQVWDVMETWCEGQLGVLMLEAGSVCVSFGRREEIRHRRSFRLSAAGRAAAEQRGAEWLQAHAGGGRLVSCRPVGVREAMMRVPQVWAVVSTLGDLYHLTEADGDVGYSRRARAARRRLGALYSNGRLLGM